MATIVVVSNIISFSLPITRRRAFLKVTAIERGEIYIFPMECFISTVCLSAPGPAATAAFLAPFSQERNSHPGDNVT